MGAVFKKTATKPLPANAEIFVRKGKRFARWKNTKGRTREAPLTTGRDGQNRIVIESGTYTAKYRDGSGVVRVVATGCRDKTAAMQRLAEWQKQVERVESGVVTAAEAEAVEHKDTPIGEHIADYLAWLERRVRRGRQGCSTMYRQNVERFLKRIMADCGFTKLRDVNYKAFDRWLERREESNASARTRNQDRAAMLAFCNWCVSQNRLTENPIKSASKADEQSDQRRKPRAMTEAELVKLLDAARQRPLLDAKRIRRGRRQGQPVAKLSPQETARLERLGRERALIYKTLLLTGLRKSELASLTIGQLQLDGSFAYADLKAADAKNRRESQIPLRADLAADLREWIAEKSTATATALPPDTPIFTVPGKLIAIFNRDLVAAGLASRTKLGNSKYIYHKRDERGRTLHVHALRTSFGTLLSKGGVLPRTAQAAMRHSTLDLTMNVYTDPKLLDVHGALDALPGLPLDAISQSECHSVKATGTDECPDGQFAPAFAPTRDNPSKSESIPVKTTVYTSSDDEPFAITVSGDAVKENNPLTCSVNGLAKVETSGIEPPTPSLQS